jgi:glycerate 2-kinase
MVIKNFKQLAKTPLREDALTIAEAGYDAIDIEQVFKRTLRVAGNVLTVQGHSYDLKKYKHIYVVGVGKGSSRAARGVEHVLGDRIVRGFVIDTNPAKTQKIFAFKGTHPLPSQQNIDATEEVVKVLEQAEKDDLVLCIICGGGSALFSRPGDRTLLELQLIGSHMLKAGAPIHDMNTVRKHVSLIHGGHLAKFAYPATVLSLYVSDVPGDDLHVIASGPTVLDPTTRKDAVRVAHKYKLPPIPFIETPKDKKYFRKVTNLVVASGDMVVEAMAEKARALGYKPVIVGRNITGLAKEVGPDLVRRVQPGEALIAAGETEVNVTHPGRGGRCQDVATSAIPYLTPDSVIVACASDGKDNEPVAGAVADGKVSAQKCKEFGLDPVKAVEMNDTFPLLEKLGDHLQTKLVTANISDFLVVVRSK